MPADLEPARTSSSRYQMLNKSVAHALSSAIAVIKCSRLMRTEEAHKGLRVDHQTRRSSNRGVP